MLRKGHGVLYKAPAKEERRKRKANMRKRLDKGLYAQAPSCSNPSHFKTDYLLYRRFGARHETANRAFASYRNTVDGYDMLYLL